MAYYAANLVAGDNIHCMTLKHGTILRYLHAAAELSLSANIPNPCLDITGKQSKYIKDILHEVKRWESVPDRREPLTKEIIKWVQNKGKKLNKTNKHNIYTALSDWLVLGLQSGFRRKEWAQDRTYLKKHKDIQRNIDKSPSAFILQDMEFRLKNDKRIKNDCFHSIKKANMVNITWRYQKNNDNGQTISYVEDKDNIQYCYVTACKRIYNRTIELKHQIDKPIAIFCDEKITEKQHI